MAARIFIGRAVRVKSLAAPRKLCPRCLAHWSGVILARLNWVIPDARWPGVKGADSSLAKRLLARVGDRFASGADESTALHAVRHSAKLQRNWDHRIDLTGTLLMEVMESFGLLAGRQQSKHQLFALA